MIMRSFRPLLIGVMLLLFFSSCKKELDQPSTGADNSLSPTTKGANPAQAQERPFKGNITGHFVSGPTDNPALYSGGAIASGNATHLGAFNKVTHDVTNITNWNIDGTFVMTSIAGEQIKGSYTGPFIFGSTPGAFSWDLDATITGGSGRFEHATGHFVFLANGTYAVTDGVVTGDYTETFDGVIVY